MNCQNLATRVRSYTLQLAVSPLTGLLTSRSKGGMSHVSRGFMVRVSAVGGCRMDGAVDGWLVGLHRWNVKVTERKSVKVVLFHCLQKSDSE